MNATDNIILFTTVLSVLNVGGVEKRQYRGVVRHNRTVRLPEIVKNAATKHGVQEGLLMYYATILFGEIGDSVLTGHRVEIDDFGSLHLTASGTFSAANAPWDAALHRMGVSIAAKGKLKAAAGVLSGKNVTEGNHVILKRVVDNLCGLENVITNTANVQVFISGDSMLITEGAEDEGVWLENERGEVVAKATVAGSTTTTVDCTFGTLPIDPQGYLSRITVEQIDDEISESESRVKSAFDMMTTIMASSPADVKPDADGDPVPWPEYIKEQRDLIESSIRENLSCLHDLCRGKPKFVPACEVWGEGLFLQFDEAIISQWENLPVVKKQEEELRKGYEGWRANRNLDPSKGFPGARFYLLHTISHLFIRELALECGYNAASIQERIYAKPGEKPMAGILVYTAASDSDGTLGGLVGLGAPDKLGAILKKALARAGTCSSDPLCSDHTHRADWSLHGAACHACAFAAETSCEVGNRYLDRSLVVPTYAVKDAAFFKGGLA